ncbi:Ger(x)C family spore germination protein [Paenibacillus oenotherae]|uniref:Ger(X)C family spore germination protein n=1 Tax=Paenibacillus oenotherae TaxID=1435645 RepID=A0ABS7D2H2_9BACL|nr:Ger(x)C family spore germination protein [Paenibacillus oenotherae]MBW7473393.1 Ger(x)C family spore germination protein [Paenibacillus oenotherae]
MRKRWVQIVLAIAILIVQSGCWNRVELNELSIISATGIDIDDKGRWRLSFQLVIPQAISSTTGVSTNAAPVYVFSTEDESMRGAVRKSSLELSRKLYFSHNQMVVISEKAARYGIGTLMEAYMRNADARETVAVFLTRESARNTLEQLVSMEKIPGAAIQHMIQNEAANGGSFPQTSVFRVQQELLGGTHATGIPSLMLAGKGSSFDSLNLMQKTHSDIKIKLGRLGIIKGDKLVGWLDAEESMGAMWLANRIQRTVLPFPCAPSRKKDSSLRIIDTDTHVKPVRKGNRFVMDVHTKVSGTLYEYSCDDDMTKPATIVKVQQAIAEEVKRVMQTGWKSLQRQQADIVGFGGAVHEKFPKQWRSLAANWNEQLDQVEVNYDVKVSVEQTGMSSNSFHSKQDKQGG